ncbi:uncharacterized protein Dwil_GK28333 [Drosophila willistoni]|uniref:Uncharacterized protein n=1 Tax=Drosophila willistoni TaxID=7260 RepID=A0A0Q9X3B0_DROWI|nr:uncharacterized protein Dwil_GK28333 [Drosophila willistoni]
MAAPQGICNDGGFYSRNGDLIIDPNNLAGLFKCVQQQHG